MQNIPKIVRERLRATESAGNHPDPDLLTAFAEKSLSDRERVTVLKHLSRCRDCRDVVAFALPPVETTDTVASSRRSGWLTWPALRWGLAAAGIVVIASLGIVQYERNSSGQMTASRLPRQAEAPRTQAKNDIPASPVPDDQDKALASNASSPPPNAPARESKLVAHAGKDARQQDEASRGYGAVGGTPAAGGPRLAFQQQVAGQASVQAPAPAPSQLFPKPPTASPSIAPSPASEPVGVGSGGQAGIAAQNMPVQGRPEDQVRKLIRAKPPVAPESGAMPTSTQSQLSLFKSGEQALPGQMGGYVVDSSGAVVSNARVAITRSDTRATTTTTVTDSQGHWMIAGLPSGNYQASAEAPGFKTTSREFAYDANRPSMFVFPLNVGNVSETVEVAGQSPAVQTEDAALGKAVVGAQVSSLSVSGRNMVNLAVLARWTITPTGGLQRSVDQGKTWQDVNVLASTIPASNFADLDSTAETVVAKEKDSRKKSLKRETIAPLVFRAVSASGAEVWAGGSQAALYHSSDGGDHWTRVIPSWAGAILAGDIIGLEFSDPQHGAVTTSTPEIWTTADAGQSWRKQ